MSTPTDEEASAALARANAAGTAVSETNKAHLAALNEFIAANREVIRITVLRTPLRDILLDDLRVVTFKRPPTLKWLTSRTYRGEDEVRAALAELIAEGLVRCDRGAYYATTVEAAP